MTDVAEKVEVEDAGEQKPKNLTPNIVRGRMPAALVYAIRFLEDGSESEIAKKYKTTGGKVNDIKKNRNFGYITEDTKFSREELDKALEHAKKLGDTADDVTEVVNGMVEGDDEDMSALEERRKSARKPRGSASEKASAAGADEADTEADESEDDVDLDALIEG